MDRPFIDFLEKNLKLDLNEQQKKAVLHKDGPGLVLAVPGAGKTTMLICRTANLILNHKIQSENILSLTFSKAAAKDMKERFNSYFGEHIQQDVHFSTIHSFAYMILKRYAYLNNTRYNLIENVNSGVNKYIILKQIYKKINNTVINDDKLEELISTIGYIKNMMLDIDDISRDISNGIKNLKLIYSEYEDYKRNNNYIDFDDMLSLTYEILSENKNIVDSLRKRYSYLQIDEGQDTSKIQNEIIKLLAKPNNNLFIVADDDQSIYGFRGAYPEYLLSFDKDYKNAKTYFMEENFRSSENIVSISNEFIKNNKYRYFKNLHTNNGNVKPINLIKLKDEFSQIDYVVDKLKSLNNHSNTAILFRNNISSIGIIECLSENNIPFYIRDNKLNFFNHWIVQDILAFLNLIIDNNNIKSFERIYYKMNGYISKKALNYIMNIKEDISVFDKLIRVPGMKTYQVDNILRLRTDFKRMLKMNPNSTIDFILHNMEYLDYLRDNCTRFGYSYDNAKILLSNLKIIANNCYSIIQLIERIQNIQQTVEKNKSFDNNAVRLSTIHSSKGLEFENVFIVDLIDGEFPSSKITETNDEKSLEEERRLFYVGMTRAKTHLELLTIKSRNKEEVYQSRFLDELQCIVNLNEGIADDYSAGTSVFHQRFGEGKVKYIEDDVITINFNSIGVKKVSLRISLERNLLKVI